MHIQKQTFDFQPSSNQQSHLQRKLFNIQQEEHSGFQLCKPMVKRKSALFQCNDENYDNYNQAEYDHVAPDIGRVQNSKMGTGFSQVNRQVKKFSTLKLPPAQINGGVTRPSENQNPFEISKEVDSKLRPSDDYLSTQFSDIPSAPSRLHSNPLSVLADLQRQNSFGAYSVNDSQNQNVFTMCNSPILQKATSINRRLFHNEDAFQIRESDSQTDASMPFSNSDISEECQMKKAICPDEVEASSQQDDVDEFAQDENRNLEQMLKMRVQNPFIFDPENGGGRRRRVKNISRIDYFLNQPSQHHKIQIKFQAPVLPKPLQAEILNSNCPMNIDPSNYSFDGAARLLEKLEDPRNQGKNSISPDTLANFLSTADQHQTPYLIVDCRFDYEYEGGHIKNAININDPQAMKDFFFQKRDNIECLMRSVIIFHCEFSQKRAPEMYGALREVDRNLHIEMYPQLFYPEIYILEGGYKGFFQSHPQLCSGNYLPMLDNNFKVDCKEKFSNHQRVYKDFNQQRRATIPITEEQQCQYSPSEFITQIETLKHL